MSYRRRFLSLTPFRQPSIGECFEIYQAKINFAVTILVAHDYACRDARLELQRVKSRNIGTNLKVDASSSTMARACADTLFLPRHIIGFAGEP